MQLVGRCRTRVGDHVAEVDAGADRPSSAGLQGRPEGLDARMMRTFFRGRSMALARSGSEGLRPSSHRGLRLAIFHLAIELDHVGRHVDRLAWR